jgi:ribosomal protein L7Ae-like RNA K-turn-binding protein
MERRAPPETHPGAPERALLSLLGLAARARALTLGTDMVRGAARDGKLAAAILAADASPTQARKLVPLLEARGIPFEVCLAQDDLGAALGRGPVSAVGLNDPSFARRVMELARALPPMQDRGGGEPY